MKKDKVKQTAIPTIPGLEVKYMSFGKRLRQIRKRRGLTQEEFAHVLGTCKQALSRYELEQASPRVNQVLKYAEKLHVSVDYLLGDDEAESPSNPFWEKKDGKPFYEIFFESIHYF